MTLHTMFYTNEIRVAEYGRTDSSVQPKEQEKKLAEQLIESLAAKFEPEKYKDQYQESMSGLIEAKRQGHEVAEAQHPKLAPVIDLMEALKKSIAEKPAPAKVPPRSARRSGRSRAAQAPAQKRASKK